MSGDLQMQLDLLTWLRWRRRNMGRLARVMQRVAVRTIPQIVVADLPLTH